MESHGDPTAAFVLTDGDLLISNVIVYILSFLMWLPLVYNYSIQTSDFFHLNYTLMSIARNLIKTSFSFNLIYRQSVRETEGSK